MTGHNRLKYHIHKIFKVGETDLCSCGQAAETAQHVLQDCRLYSNVRQSIWRERVDMHTKLYGPLPKLEKTVAFIAKPGIGIWRERWRTRRRRRLIPVSRLVPLWLVWRCLLKKKKKKLAQKICEIHKDEEKKTLAFTSAVHSKMTFSFDSTTAIVQLFTAIEFYWAPVSMTQISIFPP